MTGPNIRELERLLQNEEAEPLDIMPSGEVRRFGEGARELEGRKPLTFQENNGGEYADSLRIEHLTPHWSR